MLGSLACIKSGHEDNYNAFTENPHYAVEDPIKSEVGKAGHVNRATDQRRSTPDRSRQRTIPQSSQARRRGTARQTVPNLPSGPDDFFLRGSPGEQPTQRIRFSCTTCHKVHANGPLRHVGGAPQRAINQQCANCHHQCLGPVPETVSSQAAGRGDELCGLPQSARKHPARDGAVLSRLTNRAV